VYLVSAASVTTVPWTLSAMYAGFLTSLVPSTWWLPLIASLPRWSGYGLGVMWTLSVEEWFYLLWAPAVRRWSDERLVLMCLGAIVVAPVVRWTLHGPGIPESYFFLSRFDALAWGALTALAWVRFRSQLAAIARVTAAAGLIGVLVVGALTAHGDRNRLLFALFGYTVLDFACAAVLLAALTHPEGQPWAWLRMPGLRRVGLISYGLYLVHQPVYQLIGTLPVGHAQTLFHGLLALALSLMLAALSWRYFESPILNRHDGDDDAAAGVEPGAITTRSIASGAPAHVS
jgi:peptidoglycan/LPS O-acetylase OafA/YrhL